MRWSLAVCAGVLLGACGGKTDTGDAGTDASTGSDGGSDAATCTYQDTRTTATRSCGTSTDCVVVVRATSCCQEEYDGIRADAAQAFNTQQAALTAGCPACGCAAQPVDELGVKGMTFAATCDNGACTAHAQ